MHQISKNCPVKHVDHGVKAPAWRDCERCCAGKYTPVSCPSQVSGSGWKRSQPLQAKFCRDALHWLCSSIPNLLIPLPFSLVFLNPARRERLGGSRGACIQCDWNDSTSKSHVCHVFGDGQKRVWVGSDLEPVKHPGRKLHCGSGVVACQDYHEHSWKSEAAVLCFYKSAKTYDELDKFINVLNWYRRYGKVSIWKQRETLTRLIQSPWKMPPRAHLRISMICVNSPLLARYLVVIEKLGAKTKTFNSVS